MREEPSLETLWFKKHEEASSIDRTQQSRFHLRMREEPSLEMLWFKKKRAMDKVQKTDPSMNKRVLPWIFFSQCSRRINTFGC
jgi:hypothetical protein